MNAIINTLQATMVQWGYPGLFISAVVSGSIFPFSSELVLIALIKLGLEPISCVLLASVGNTIGGMSCYYMGYAGKTEWVEKYMKLNHDKIDSMQKKLKKHGSYMAFFAFLPAVGEVIAVTLGFMRTNQFATTTSMFVGKLIRYIAMTIPLLFAINSLQKLLLKFFQ
jgi:membrane protein YqaA with SNARE-associated domain